jgi:hypothetical protein
MDPDLDGPKTFGSGGSGFGTLNIIYGFLKVTFYCKGQVKLKSRNAFLVKSYNSLLAEKTLLS